MSYILYYSTNCRNCDKIMNELARTELQKNIHFVCIDRRVKRNEHTYVQMENGEEVLLPRNVTKVPALLLLQENNRVIFGNAIYNLFMPDVNKNVKKEAKMDLPREFGTLGMLSSNCNVQSASYGMLDEGDEDGVSQNGYYVSALYDNIEQIETPDEDYIPDKLNEDSMKRYKEERDRVVPMAQKPPMPKFSEDAR